MPGSSKIGPMAPKPPTGLGASYESAEGRDVWPRHSGAITDPGMPLSPDPASVLTVLKEIGKSVTENRVSAAADDASLADQCQLKSVGRLEERLAFWARGCDEFQVTCARVLPARRRMQR